MLCYTTKKIILRFVIPFPMSDVARYEFFLFPASFILTLELLARRLNLPPVAAFILGGTGLVAFTTRP
ncbi:hypothetical protein AOR01nite_26060 [Acetobacter orleanensis]|uniref:Uncharacterized protein n=1 Tax=Acetobacter orleanensis TaxID=104099 RepID=A0A4Y3TRM1_9PROT|nr:hypothetical protein Abol_049_003 [Acetobacter orleanensis JCM 7639]GEB84129.1 hypothetical protein AOR01nite_26060 [Acetobacter orleanensis]